MKGGIKSWVDFGEYDLESAEHLFYGGKFLYTIALCHSALEKLLKAKIEEHTGKAPPKTQNLRYLVKLTGIEIPIDMLIFFSRLDEVNVLTKDTEDFDGVKKCFDIKAAETYLFKAKETFQWIKRYIKLLGR